MEPQPRAIGGEEVDEGEDDFIDENMLFKKDTMKSEIEIPIAP